jgi:transcription-repair coupling factor (superfamily II helicase)
VRPRLEVVFRTDFVITREAEWAGRKAGAVAAAAFLPASYIAEAQPRIQAYRRLAEVTTQEHLDALRKTWRDRFGLLPEAAENLLVMTEIRLAASQRKITQVEAREGKLILTRGGDYVQIGGKFPRLSAVDPNGQLREILAMIRSF